MKMTIEQKINEKLLAYAKPKGISEEELINKIQDKYKALLSENNYTNLKGLIELIGIKPLEELVQKKYIDYLKDDIKYKDLIHFKDLMDSTGIKPSEEVIQKIHEKYVFWAKLGNLSLVINWKKYFDIEPKFSEEIIQEIYNIVQVAYKNGLNSDAEYFNEIKKFEDISGIKLTEESIQDVYMAYSSWYNNNKNIEKLKELTGIEPKYSEKKAQEIYKESLQHDCINIIAYQKNITGIKPKFTEEEIQKNYSDNIKDKHFNHIKTLIDITGIEPKEDIYECIIDFLK